MGDVVAWKPKPKPDPRQRNVRVSVLILIGAWGMLFFTLLFVFAALRITAAQWPPPATPPLPRLQGALALLFSAVGAAGAFAAVKALGSGRPKASLSFAAVVAGIGCLIAQTLSVLQLRAARATGDFGSLVSMSIFLHLVCAALGLAGLLTAAVGTARGRYTAQQHAGPSSWAVYQAFVAGVWMVLYATMFWL